MDEKATEILKLIEAKSSNVQVMLYHGAEGKLYQFTDNFLNRKLDDAPLEMTKDKWWLDLMTEVPVKAP